MTSAWARVAGYWAPGAAGAVTAALLTRRHPAPAARPPAPLRPQAPPPPAPGQPPSPPGSGTSRAPSWPAAQASSSPRHGTGAPATSNAAASSPASASTLSVLAASAAAARRGPSRWRASPARPAASRHRHRDRPA